MKYQEWQNKQNRFIAMTGYSVEMFNSLLPCFTDAHHEYLSQYHLTGKRRRGYRQYVMYKNSPLPCIEERLAFILSYIKLNPLQEHHADLFNIEQKQCYQLVHGLRIILDKALASDGCMPAQTDSELQLKLAELSNDEDGMILIHDGTEREVPRPQDSEQQKEKYSGKKKKHTVKNAVITSATCAILFVSQTFSGHIHDKTIADTSIAYLPDLPFFRIADIRDMHHWA
jgi:hypothetical protein